MGQVNMKLNFHVQYLFILMLPVAIVIYFCTSTKYDSKQDLSTKNKVNIVYGNLYMGELTTIEYDGHKFIIYYYNGGKSIIHHPSCLCLKKE